MQKLLDAAHLREYRDHGSHDARNGLVFCSLHHRAFDSWLFGIEPKTLAITIREGGPSLSELHITRSSLADLTRKPHADALEWRWKLWLDRGK